MRSTIPLCFFALLSALFSITGCGNGYGEKIVVDGTEIYYDGESATKTDAEKLGQSLKESGFTDGQEKAVQLQRHDEKYVFRMVTKQEYIDSDEFEQNFQMMCLQLSAAFDGAVVDCHACNDQLETQKEIRGLAGKLTDLGKSELYYNSVTDEQLEAVKTVLTKLGFEDAESSLFFGKDGNTFEFRMVCSEEFYNDEELHNETKIWQDDFSKAVDGEPVVVMLCDEYFQSKFTRTVE